MNRSMNAYLKVSLVGHWWVMTAVQSAAVTAARCDTSRSCWSKPVRSAASKLDGRGTLRCWLGAEVFGEGKRGVERFWSISTMSWFIISSFVPAVSRFRQDNSSQRMSALKPVWSSGVASLQFTSIVRSQWSCTRVARDEKVGKSKRLGTAGELHHRAGEWVSARQSATQRARCRMARTKRVIGLWAAEVTQGTKLIPVLCGQSGESHFSLSLHAGQ